MGKFALFIGIYGAIIVGISSFFITNSIAGIILVIIVCLSSAVLSYQYLKGGE